MNILKRTIITLTLIMGIGVATLPVSPVYAVNVFESCDSSDSDSKVCAAAKEDSAFSMVQTVINTMLIVLGSVAVIMIVIGGIRYTLSGGDSTGVSNAKNTIIYAVVGLIVAIMAYAIVNFVVSRFI